MYIYKVYIYVVSCLKNGNRKTYTNDRKSKGLSVTEVEIKGGSPIVQCWLLLTF